MKPVIYAFIGIVLYAIQNTIIDVKLKQHSTVGLLMGIYIILLPLAAGLFFYQKLSGQSMSIPTGSSFKILAAVAVMFFVADFFYVGAYTSGGNVVVITIMLVLMPVIGTFMKFVWIKERPTMYHFVGFILATCAVICIAIGNSKKTPIIAMEEQASTAELTPK